MSSVELSTAVEQAKLVVILTAHPEVDYKAVQRAAPLVLDFRGVLRKTVSTQVGTR